MTISPGTYRIQNAKSGTYLDASRKEKGEVHGWASRPQNENQKWIVEQSGRGVHIKNAENNEYLCARGDHEGASVHVGQNASEWEIKKDGDKYNIYLAGKDLVVDLHCGSSEDGTEVKLQKKSARANQQDWEFEKAGGGGGYGGQQQAGGYSQQQQGGYGQQQQGGYGQQQPQQRPAGNPNDPSPTAGFGGGGSYSGAVPAGRYNIYNLLSNKGLDLAGAKGDDRTPVLNWDPHNGDNQKWDLVPGNNGYLIKNVATGTYLGYPQQGDCRQGTEISGNQHQVEYQVNESGQDSQGNPAYQIVVADNPNLVLDLKGADGNNGTPICLWSNGNGQNQKWNLRRC